MDTSILNYVHPLLIGLGNSLLISSIGIVAGGMLGMALGAVRYARIPIASQLIGLYVNVLRCTPLIVQIFMLYFALPEIGIRLSPFTTSWIALAMWGAAYQTEVFRAAYKAVSPSDIQATRALGMSASETFFDVVMPIGLRTAFPAATTNAITQFRSSSFMIVVGYNELTYVANQLVSETYRVFQIFGIAALMYLLVCTMISIGSRWIEGRFHIAGTGAA